MILPKFNTFEELDAKTKVMEANEFDFYTVAGKHTKVEAKVYYVRIRFIDGVVMNVKHSKRFNSTVFMLRQSKRHDN